MNGSEKKDKIPYNRRKTTEEISSQLSNNVFNTSDTTNDEKATGGSNNGTLPCTTGEKPVLTINSKRQEEFKETKNESNPTANSILSNNVNAKEFIPSAIHRNPSLGAETSTDMSMLSTTNIFSSATCSTQDSQPTLLSENQVVIDVLKDIIADLMEDPGGYDDVEKKLGEHFKNFVTKKETLDEIVSILIEQVSSFLTKNYFEKKNVEKPVSC